MERKIVPKIHENRAQWLSEVPFLKFWEAFWQCRFSMHFQSATKAIKYGVLVPPGPDTPHRGVPGAPALHPRPRPWWLFRKAGVPAGPFSAGSRQVLGGFLTLHVVLGKCGDLQKSIRKEPGALWAASGMPISTSVCQQGRSRQVHCRFLAGSWLCMSCWVSSVICKINGPKTMPKSTEMNTTNLPKIDNNYAWGAFGRPLGHQLVPRTHPRSFPHDDCLTFWGIISDFGRGGFWRGSQNLHFWYRMRSKV